MDIGYSGKRVWHAILAPCSLPIHQCSLLAAHHGIPPCDHLTHPVFINMDWPEVRVVQKLGGLEIYGGLAMTLVAQAPVWIDKSPKGWTCKIKNTSPFERGQQCESLRPENILHEQMRMRRQGALPLQPYKVNGETIRGEH